MPPPAPIAHIFGQLGHGVGFSEVDFFYLPDLYLILCGQIKTRQKNAVKIT